MPGLMQRQRHPNSGLGFRVQGCLVGLRVKGSGFREGLGFRVQGSGGSRVKGSGFREGLGFRV